MRAQRAHVFIALMVHGQMDGSERASADLLLDHILVDAVDRSPVSVRVGVLGSRVKRFLDLMRGRRLPPMVTEGAFVGWRRAVEKIDISVSH